MKTEYFVGYKNIVLNKVKGILPRENSTKLFPEIISRVKGRPVIIEAGKDLKLLVGLYILLRAVVPEIAIRTGISNETKIVYSTLHHPKYIRPSNVSFIIDTPEMLGADYYFSAESANKKEVFWILPKVITYEDAAFADYRKKLYCASPMTKIVRLKGKTLPVYLLFTLEWFLPYVEKLYFETALIKDKK